LVRDYLTALLIESTPDSLRLIHLDAMIEVDRAGVLEMAEDGPACVVADGELRMVPVRLRLNAGAVLREIGDAAHPRQTLANNQAPFLVAVRQARPMRPADAESYTRKETEFLRRWGLIDEP
jgi:hypothetical protein